jgi:3-oxoacyl-ACP reductase-like protein
MLLHKCTLNVWASLFPLAAAAAPLEVLLELINLYSRYLKHDPRQGEILYDKERASSAQIQAWLDSIASEHGDTYIDGIQPIFDALKARHFDSL